jgi:hypothetical protein
MSNGIVATLKQWCSSRGLIFLGSGTLAAVVLAGCGGLEATAPGGIASYLPHMRRLEHDCHGPINGLDDFDFSGSAIGSPELLASREQGLKTLAMQVAACGGYVQALGFSKSEADAVPLAEAAFPASTSGTTTARLIAAHKSAEAFVSRARQAIPKAMKAVGPAGTDVLAQLQLAAQVEQQHGGAPLHLTLATDGIATAGPIYMETSHFTVPVAERAGTEVEVPNLAGATLQFVGIGRTAAAGRDQLPTARVEALLAFYRIVCKRTEAASCSVVTDYAQGGE